MTIKRIQDIYDCGFKDGFHDCYYSHDVKHGSELSLKKENFLKFLNADITNGDMMKVIFPNIEVEHHYEKELGMNNGYDIIIHENDHQFFQFWVPSSWWDTPFRKE